MYLSERLGLVEQARTDGLQLKWNDSLDGDVQRQIELIGSAIESNRYGIVLDTRTLYATDIAISAAVEHNIPVVIMLNRLPIPPSQYLSYILEDVHEGSRLVMARMQMEGRAKDDVVLLGSDSLTPGAADRFASVESSLSMALPGARVVDRIVGPPSVGYFETALEQSLSKRQSVGTVIAMNNQAGIAAVAAIRALHAEKRISIIAFDQTVELLLLLRRGELDSILAQNSRDMGRLAVSSIVAAHQGRGNPAYSYVPPVLITRDNIDTESVQQILQMN